MTVRFPLLAIAALLASAAAPRAQIALPVTFEESIDYELRGFEGNTSQIVADPVDASNRVVETVRSTDAATFAGTVVADVSGFAQPVPFAEGATTMSVDVWSPTAGTPVRLKLENASDGGVSVETEAKTTQAGAWETLVFDFSDEATGTANLNLASTYNKGVIFFNFGAPAPATATTYYWDNLAFGGAPPPKAEIALPVSFEEGVDYELNDFGGNESRLVADPEDATNTVVESVRTAGAECFAGTTVADKSGFAQPIPFAPGATTMSVRVWSPEAGVRVLFKVEEVGVPTVNVETFTFTTVAEQWETLVFDFGDPKPNLNPINFGNTYNKASIFFDFQCNLPPTATSPGTYYWDDVAFGGAATNTDGPPSDLVLTPSVSPNPSTGDATVTFNLAAPTNVTVEVVDLLGRRVAILAAGTRAAGTVRLRVPSASLAPGTYLVRARTPQGTASVRMSVVR